MIPRKKLSEIDLLLGDMLGWVKPADIPAAKKHKEKIYSYLEKLSDKPCPECKSIDGYHPAECSRAMVL